VNVNDDLFADYTYGKIALEKMKPTDPNFRLYEAGWLGPGNQREVMEVKGAVFRTALRGPRKGELCILIKGTEQVAYVTSGEMDAYDKLHPEESNPC
jgi:hypothetical protein